MLIELPVSTFLLRLTEVEAVSSSNVERDEDSDVSSEDEHSPSVEEVGDSPEYRVQLSVEAGLAPGDRLLLTRNHTVRPTLHTH